MMRRITGFFFTLVVLQLALHSTVSSVIAITFGPEDLSGGRTIINKPEAIERYDTASGGEIGMILFISQAIRIATAVAGVWVLFNLIIAGFTMITADKSDGLAKVGSVLYMSVLGLALILVAYTFAGLVGLIYWGDPTYIINPQIPEVTL